MPRKRTVDATTSANVGSAGPDVQRLPMKVRGPADVAVMIPYLLGFYPHQSLVMVALVGEPPRFGPVLRVDLVADPTIASAQLRQILDVALRQESKRVLVAAFSVDAQLADPMVKRLTDVLAGRGIAVQEALRIGDGRYWSYLCSNPDCCDPAGTPYEAGTSRMTAEAVFAGMSYAADRDALRALFAPASPERRAEVAREVTRARSSDPSVLPTAAALLLPDRLRRHAATEAELSAAEVAWLAIAVQSFVGQDAAYTTVGLRDAAEHLRVWRAVMVAVADDLMPPVGCLAAFSAWLDGRSVVASHAVDRVFEVVPQHPMARRIEVLLARAVDPRTWFAEPGRSGRGGGGHRPT